ncbi:hypothetical protein BKI52_02640 [marine bacterium AO1-C]|nr:hypothetical protein BKI52_02640 [marine bacterium AO1-C]
MQLSDNQRKGLIVTGIVLALGLVALGIYKLVKKNTNKPEELGEFGLGENTPKTKEDLPKSPARPVEPLPDEEVNFTGQPGQTFPLNFGQKGKEVEQLQLWLFRTHGIQTFRNGIFDNHTLTAVKKVFGEDAEVTEGIFKKHRMSDYKTYQYK